MKIASWNVNSVSARVDGVSKFIHGYDPDVLMLQETKSQDHLFPIDLFPSYNCYIHGQKSYNGVAILSKEPMEDICTTFPANALPDEARFIEGRIPTKNGILRIINLYIPNGGDIGSDKYLKKIAYYDALYEYIRTILDEPVFIAGDFNVTPMPIDSYDHIKTFQQTCGTAKERALFRKLLGLGLIDLYRTSNPSKEEYSWWDYRAGAFKRNNGLRIDFMLSSASLTSYFSKCDMLKQYRAIEKPSDHIPITISFDF